MFSLYCTGTNYAKPQSRGLCCARGGVLIPLFPRPRTQSSCAVTQGRKRHMPWQPIAPTKKKCKTSRKKENYEEVHYASDILVIKVCRRSSNHQSAESGRTEKSSSQIGAASASVRAPSPRYKSSHLATRLRFPPSEKFKCSQSHLKRRASSYFLFKVSFVRIPKIAAKTEMRYSIFTCERTSNVANNFVCKLNTSIHFRG